MMQKKTTGVRALVGSMLVAAGALPAVVFAQAADYGALAAAGAGGIQADFDQVFAAAIPIMLVIVGAMVAWKYGKKLFSKV